MIRLQGEKFQMMRPLLKFVSYSESKNGHIRANMRLKTDPSNKVIYYHWLNEEEEKKFKSGPFYSPEYKFKRKAGK
jgi:hypothetical protein